MRCASSCSDWDRSEPPWTGARFSSLAWSSRQLLSCSDARPARRSPPRGRLAAPIPRRTANRSGVTGFKAAGEGGNEDIFGPPLPPVARRRRLRDWSFETVDENSVVRIIAQREVRVENAILLGRHAQMHGVAA